MTSSGSKVGHEFVLSKISSLFCDCMQWSWAALEAPQCFRHMQPHTARRQDQFGR
jgi:hypothetical protein